MSRNTVGIGVLTIAIAGFFVLLAVGLLNKSPLTGLSGITRVHKPAPDFTLPLLDGGELALSQFHGKSIVINFWSSWCPPCREESPVLENTWRAFKDNDVLFVGVVIQDTENASRLYLQEFDITYPNGLDANGKITVDYGVIGIPVTFFVDSAGIVSGRFVGAINERQLVERIDELVAGAAQSQDVNEDNLKDFFKFY